MDDGVDSGPGGFSIGRFLLKAILVAAVVTVIEVVAARLGFPKPFATFFGKIVEAVLGDLPNKPDEPKKPDEKTQRDLEDAERRARDEKLRREDAERKLRDAHEREAREARAAADAADAERRRLEEEAARRKVIGSDRIRPEPDLKDLDRPRGWLGTVVAEYRGTYWCSQGETSLVLKLLDRSINQRQRVVFAFGPLARNPGGYSGEFLVEGVLNAHGLSLHPVSWIVQPPGYYMVGLEGRSPDGGAYYQGRIVEPTQACASFSVRRTR